MTTDATFDQDTDNMIDQVMPALAEVEQKRVEYLASYKKRQPIFYIVCAVALAAVIVLATYWDPVFAFVIGGAAAMGTWYWADEPARHYRRDYKVTLLPRIARGLGDFSYMVAGGIQANRMQPSGILPNYDRYEHEDHFAGTYKDVGIEFCEARLAVRRRSRRRTYYQVVFQGLIVMLDMPRPFNGRTVVRRDAGLFNWMQRLGPLESIKLEDPQFEKLFEVHGSDQVEARMLLTPAFMERLKGLQETVGARSLECAFYDDRLLILMQHTGAMTTKGLLEPGPLKASAEDRAVVEKIAGEFARICGIADELKLVERRRAMPPTPPTEAPTA